MKVSILTFYYFGSIFTVWMSQENSGFSHYETLTKLPSHKFIASQRAEVQDIILSKGRSAGYYFVEARQAHRTVTLLELGFTKLAYC